MPDLSQRISTMNSQCQHSNFIYPHLQSCERVIFVNSDLDRPQSLACSGTSSSFPNVVSTALRLAGMNVFANAHRSRRFQQSFVPHLGHVVSAVLPSYMNGITEIAMLLAQCPNVQTVHIHANGEPGLLMLGNVALTAKTIERYAWDIQAWFGFIPSFIQPSLILDGCNVGDGVEGRALVDRLHHLTGCHITCRQSSSPRHLQLV